VWNGKSGAFTAKAAVKARNSRTPSVPDRWVCMRAGSSKVSTPVWDWWRKAMDRIPTSRNAEPAKV
jgi:hypothetical protein